MQFNAEQMNQVLSGKTPPLPSVAPIAPVQPQVSKPIQAAPQPTQQATKKYSVDDLGARVRAGNPSAFQNLNVSDADIGKRVLQRKPELGSLIEGYGPAQAGENTPAPVEVPKQQGLVSKIGHFLTSGTQKFADTLGTAAATVTPASNGLHANIMPGQHGSSASDVINRSAISESESQKQLAALLNRPDISETQKAHIRSQLGQGSQVVTAERALPSINKTAGQIYGEGALAGLEALSGGGIEAIGKGVAKQGLKVIGTGFKTGALYGGLGNAANAASEGQGISGVVGSGLTGAAIGGALGAAVPAAFGAGKLVRKTALPTLFEKSTKEQRAVIDMVRPLLNKGETAEAIGSGRGISQTLLREGGVLPAQQDKNIAQAVQGIVDPKKDLISNVNAVRGAIKSEAQGVVQHLQEHDGIFNQNQLASHLDSVEKSPLLVSDAGLEKAYGLAKDKFMSFVEKNKKNLSGLLQSRKEFDEWLRSNNGIPMLYSESRLSPLKQAVIDMRNAANGYIEERLPTDSPFRASLNKQSLMYRALDNMSEKAAKTDVNKTGLQKFAKKYPLVRKAAGYVAGGTAGTYGIKKIFGN